MTSKTFAAGVLIAIVAAMALASRLDAAESERLQMRYCENVVMWRVEASQGVEPLRRSGHPDYKLIAEATCPLTFPFLLYRYERSSPYDPDYDPDPARQRDAPGAATHPPL